MDNREKSIHDSVFRVGVVSSVDGREVKVKMDRNKNSSHLLYKGHLIKNVSVGSYVKILKGFMPIIGKVESEYIYENNIVNNNSVHSAEAVINRVLVVKLIGFIDGLSFKRGVNELPLIDNECHLLSDKEFTMIHTLGSLHDEFIQIGHLANDPLVPVSLGVGKLFSNHIGIFGNTGSGKSYTLSKLYRQLFVHYDSNKTFKNNSKFLFFDFNGEYSGKEVITSDKKVYKLSTHDDRGDKIPMADNDFLDVNLLSIFSNATEKTQRPFLSRCISLYRTIADNEEKFKNFLKGQIVDILQISEKDITRVFNSSNNISDFWGNSNFVVIDLSGVNTDTKKRIPLLLTNKLYNEHKAAGKAKSYLNIVVDEAHNILSHQSTRESEEWKDYRLEVFEEIIKEGRKFGVFLTIASQRPSDISSTIISQLHNYFIHRLVNERDIEQVNNTISYLDKVSVESLPILSTGVCVIAGQLAEMPLVVQVNKIEEKHRPNNETINVEKWFIRHFE